MLIFPTLNALPQKSDLNDFSEQNDFTAYYQKGQYLSELNQSDSAIAYFNQAITKTNIPDSLAKVYLSLSEEYRLIQEISNAEFFLENIRKLIRVNDTLDKSFEYELFHLEAKLKIAQGNYLDALKLFDSALYMIDLIEGKDSPASIKVINYKGIAFYYLGDQEQAFYFYREAMEKCLKLGIRNIDLADTYQNIAIAYSFRGEFDNALEYLEKSRVIREEIYSDSHPRMAGFYVNYGRIMSMVGRSAEAFTFYQKADKIMSDYAIENDVWWAHLQVNMGTYLQLRNDFEKALVYYQSALSIYQNYYEPGNSLIVTVSNNIANIYIKLDEFDKAKSIITLNIDNPGSAYNEVQLYRNLGRANAGLLNHEAAKSGFTKAVEISLKEWGNDHFETANSMITLADYLRETGDVNASIEYFSQAAEILQKIFGKEDSEYADVIRKMARAYSFNKDFRRADSLYSLAEHILTVQDTLQGELVAHSNSNSLISIRLVDNYFWWASLYHNWYKTDSDLSKLHKSIALFDKAIAIYDEVGLFITDESRMLLNQSIKAKLSEAIDVAATIFTATSDTIFADKAFSYAEKGRATLLLSSLRKSETLLLAGVSDSLINYEQQLREDLSVVQKMIYEEQQKTFIDENRLAIMEKRQLLLMESIDNVYRQIQESYPEYAELMFNTGVISLKDVQNELAENEYFTSYASGEQNYYLIYADKINRGLYKIDTEKQKIDLQVKALLNEFKKDLSVHSKSDYLKFSEISGFLYENLIQPIAEKALGKKLLILPEGLLGYLPFEVLIQNSISDSSRIDYRNLAYMINDFPIAYCYSATLHFSQHITSDSGNGKLLAFVPDYNQFNELVLNSGDAIVLSELPYARLESEMVLNIFDGEMAAGAEATKQKFISQASDFSMLHLAMHTILDNEKPMYSRLIFQQESDSLDAYSVSTYELFGMDLEASLVVLSACNTGSGVYREGEGIISLTRGFMHAGVPSIVMTNWEVHDQTGSWLMERFYKYLNEGMSKDKALQQSKKDFINQANQLKAHPYFWASYVVIGDQSPLPKEKNGFIYLFLIVATVSIAFVLVYKRFST